MTDAQTQMPAARELLRHDFHSDLTQRGSLASPVPQQVIIDETMLFGAGLEFAQTYGGPLTQAALREMALVDGLAPAGYQWIVDSRSHMLMPGQYPAIPGWHCDGVPRGGYDAQPDLDRMDARVRHVAGHVSTHPDGVSDTEYVSNGVTLHGVDPENVWDSVNRAVEDTTLMVETPGDGVLASFPMPQIHRATPARNRGWRWWIHASLLPAKPKDRIRRQVQVYTDLSKGSGW